MWGRGIPERECTAFGALLVRGFSFLLCMPLVNLPILVVDASISYSSLTKLRFARLSQIQQDSRALVVQRQRRQFDERASSHMLWDRPRLGGGFGWPGL